MFWWRIAQEFLSKNRQDVENIAHKIGNGEGYYPVSLKFLTDGILSEGVVCDRFAGIAIMGALSVNLQRISLNMLFKTGPWSRITVFDYAWSISMVDLRKVLPGTPAVRLVITGKSNIMNDHSGPVHGGLKGSSLTEKYISTRINIRAMSPLLLDSRDLLRIGLVTIPVATAIFAGGFVFGFQKRLCPFVCGGNHGAFSKYISRPNEIVTLGDKIRLAAEHR